LKANRLKFFEKETAFIEAYLKTHNSEKTLDAVLDKLGT
jgi:hypothetical protein